MANTSNKTRARWRANERTTRDDLARPAAPVSLRELTERTGLDVLRSVMTGALPPAPMSKVLNFFLAEVEPGRVVFQGDPNAAFYNLLGTIHGGWSSTILDSCVACAVHTLLPLGKGYVTVELKVNFVRSVTPNCGPLRAEGKVINMGGRIATAEGRLTDATGLLYAHATTTCLIFDMSERKRAR